MAGILREDQTQRKKLSNFCDVRAWYPPGHTQLVIGHTPSQVAEATGTRATQTALIQQTLTELIPALPISHLQWTLRHQTCRSPIAVKRLYCF